MHLASIDPTSDDRGSTWKGQKGALITALALTLFACHSFAQPASTEAAPVALDLTAYRVVVEASDDGPVERLESAISAAPGDVIEWRLEARSDSDTAVRGVALELPVPDSAVYLGGSAAASRNLAGEEPSPLDPAELTFSADGGLSFGPAPLTREIVELVNGESITTLATIPASEYTHVRLVVDSFEPDTSYFLTLRAEVR